MTMEMVEAFERGMGALALTGASVRRMRSGSWLASLVRGGAAFGGVGASASEAIIDALRKMVFADAKPAAAAQGGE